MPHVQPTYQQRATRQGLGRFAADLLLKQGAQLELFPSQLIQHYL
jgi:hypothetical protein